MAILKIARMGHPVLAGIANPVEDPTDPAVHRLIANMVDTMLDAPGPQVHAPKLTYRPSATETRRYP